MENSHFVPNKNGKKSMIRCLKNVTIALENAQIISCETDDLFNYNYRYIWQIDEVAQAQDGRYTARFRIFDNDQGNFDVIISFVKSTVSWEYIEEDTPKDAPRYKYPIIKGKPVFTIVKQVIDKYDYLGLLDMGAPEDEYDIESAPIAERVRADNTVEEIAAIISEVFTHWFFADERYSPEKCMDAAKEIKQGLAII